MEEYTDHLMGFFFPFSSSHSKVGDHDDYEGHTDYMNPQIRDLWEDKDTPYCPGASLQW